MSKQTAKDQPLSPTTVCRSSSQSKFINDLADNVHCSSASWFFTSSEDSLQFRRLSLEDFDKGYLSQLGQLTEVGDISLDEFRAQFERIDRNKDYTVQIAEDVGGHVVGCATLLVERKFIHRCGVVGHIEDVVVSEDVRRKGLGAGQVDCLVLLARQQGCYKVMLDCNEKNVAFYEHCGFQRHSNHLALYYH